MSKKKMAINFAMQATILAVASIISKLIGMIYNIPFANMLSDEGNGYYGKAQTVYAFVLLIATFSIPSAVSKIMAERIQRGEYRNVKRIMNGTFMYVLIVGGIAAVFVYVCAPMLVSENTVLSLRILAPTIFLSGFLSVYRGYFQSYGNMVPTSVSQIVEQIFNAIFSIVMAMLFMKWAAANGYADNTSKYGAAGGTVGTGVAVLAGLIYMVLLFRGEKRELDYKIESDASESVLSYKQVFKLLLMIATPMILSAAIYNINVPLDMTIYEKLLAHMGMSEKAISGQYGIYSRMYLVLANVPIAMAAAVASAVIPNVSATFASGKIEECNSRILQSLRLTMVLTVPCAVGFAVLGGPVGRLIYYSLSDTNQKMLTNMLLIGGISIVLYGISSVLNGVLQGIGKVNIPVFSAVMALILHIFLLVPLITLAKLGVYSLIIATAFYAVVVVGINWYYVRKYLGFKMEWRQTVVVPVVSAAIMGIVAIAVYNIIHRAALCLWGNYLSNAVATLIAILFAVLVYFISMFKIGGYNEEMLLAFPKGNLLIKLAKKIHLL